MSNPPAKNELEYGQPPKECVPFTEDEQMLEKKYIEKVGEEVYNKLSAAKKIQYVRGYAREKDPVKEGGERIEKLVEWYEKEEVFALRSAELPRVEQFHELWPIATHGVDRWGRPVSVSRVGFIKTEKMLKAFTVEEMLRLHIQDMEKLVEVKERLSEKMGLDLYKHTVILDMEGIGRKHMMGEFKAAFKILLDVDSNFYPESMHRMLLINTPFVFKMIWALVSPMLHHETRARITVCGGKYIKTLEQFIDIDQIPKQFGGKCICGDNNCFDNKHLERTGVLPAPTANTTKAVEQDIEKLSIDGE